ncbi:hypothetical protein [Demequina activiva]|nr:hypothetical protein [Demequina activiva]
MTTEDGRGARPATLRWIAHPASVAGIAVLVLNDHVLKAEFGSWWTGKLSDIAGLIFFPALLAAVASLAVPRASARLLMPAAIAVTGIGFTVVKATDMGAATASAVLTAITWPSTVLRDPTDLVALAALAVAAWTAHASLRDAQDTQNAQDTQGARTDGHTRWRAAVLVPIAVLASVATSAPEQSAVTVVETVGDQVWAGVGSAGPVDVHREAGSFSGAWYTLQPDGTWEGSRQGDPDREALPEPEDAPAAGTLVRCSSANGDLCFRPAEGAQGVEMSSDGGATWDEDYRVSDAALEDLAQRLEAGASEIMTIAVAVVDSEDGMQVYAANGVDGLAVRATDGTWERIGLPGYDGISAPLPLLGERPGHPTYLVPLGLVVLLAFAGPVVFALAAVWSRQRRLGTGAWLTALLLAGGGTVMAVVAVRATATSTGDDAPPPDAYVLTPLPVLGFALMGLTTCAVAAVIVTTSCVRVLGYASVTGIALAGAAATVAQVLDFSVALALACAAAVALAGTIAAARLVPRRWPRALAEPEQRPADAPVT